MRRTFSPEETLVLATLQPHCMTVREIAALAELEELETLEILHRLGESGRAQTIAAGWWSR